MENYNTGFLELERNFRWIVDAPAYLHVFMLCVCVCVCVSRTQVLNITDHLKAVNFPTTFQTKQVEKKNMQNLHPDI